MTNFHFYVILAVAVYVPDASPAWRTFLFWLFFGSAIFSALTSGGGA